MKEGYYDALAKIAERMSRWAARQEPILEQLSKEVKGLQTPESRALYEAEQEQLFQACKSEDQE